MLAAHTEKTQCFQNSCVRVKVMTTGSHATVLRNLFCKKRGKELQATTYLEL